MKRNVYLEGEIGAKYGNKFSIEGDSFSDILRCLECNFPTLRSYFIEADENNVGFICEVEGKTIENYEGLLIQHSEGDMTITAVPAGSKSGGAKILTGALMIGALFIPGGAALVGMNLSAGAAAAGASATSIMGVASANMAAAAAAGTAASMGSIMALGAMSVGLNLVMAGIQQMMAPDPSVDNQQDESYLFGGSKHNIIEGDPVPILYGELRVPGRTISFHTRNERSQFFNNNSRATSEEEYTYPITNTPGPGGGGGGGGGQPGQGDTNIYIQRN